MNGLLVAARVSALATLLVITGCSSTERRPSERTSSQGAEEFTRIAEVLKSPRCLNCHPAGDAPRQGDERRVHDFGVTRGPDDLGVPGLTCSTCHQETNQQESGVPGAPHWRVAPAKMGWEGLSDSQLCGVLLDPYKNGGRSVEDLVHHMTEDALIKWAWEPDGERTPPPIPRAEFYDLVRAWAAKGAACPRPAG
jgi:hypothetical protein